MLTGSSATLIQCIHISYSCILHTIYLASGFHIFSVVVIKMVSKVSEADKATYIDSFVVHILAIAIAIDITTVAYC